MNYRIADNSGITGLERGKVYTREEIEKNHPGLGGVDRLLGHKTLVETTDKPTSAAEQVDPLAPELNTGNPPPISRDEERQEEFRREHSPGGATGDAAERRNPPRGGAGVVHRAAAPAPKKSGKDGDGE